MLSEDLNAIDSVLSGNSAAYSELVEKYERRLLGLLVHTCGSRELAEDMTQETFARAYRKLNLFSGESQFFTWLARIAMNLLASERRRKRIENQVQREGMEMAMDSVGTSDRPEDRIQQVETQDCVRGAIEMLDDERRTILILRDFDGMDYEAISETLQIPIGTVRSRLHRARSELKIHLRERATQLGLSGT